MKSFTVALNFPVQEKLLRQQNKALEKEARLAVSYIVVLLSLLCTSYNNSWFLYCCFQFAEKAKAKALAPQQAAVQREQQQQQQNQQWTSSSSPSSFLMTENLPTLNIGYIHTYLLMSEYQNIFNFLKSSKDLTTLFHSLQNIPSKKQQGRRESSSTTSSRHKQQLAATLDGPSLEHLDLPQDSSNFERILINGTNL